MNKKYIIPTIKAKVIKSIVLADSGIQEGSNPFAEGEIQSPDEFASKRGSIFDAED